MTRTTRRPSFALAVALLAAATSLTACGSDAASTASSAASNVASGAASAASDGATNASSMASDAATDASSAATSATSAAADAMPSATQTTETTTSPATSTTDAGKSYSMAVVNDHDNETSCWAAIDGGVYDLTKWINEHPGGPQRIKGVCGQDATRQFSAQHGSNEEARSRLAQFKIGTFSG